MADQNITELPVKTSSGMTSSDYMLGIDSAEGYQMLIRDLGDYIIRNVQVNTIAGANQTLKSALDALNSKILANFGTILAADADLNTITAVGRYSCTQSSNLVNSPVNSDSKPIDLIVFYRGSEIRVWQLAFFYDSTNPTAYIRVQNGVNTWTRWLPLGVDGINHNLTLEQELANGTDLNTLTTPGSFICATGAISQTLSNWPASGVGGRLEVISILRTIGSAPSERLRQIVFPNNSLEIYQRVWNGSSWGAWVLNARNTMANGDTSGSVSFNVPSGYRGKLITVDSNADRCSEWFVWSTGAGAVAYKNIVSSSAISLSASQNQLSVVCSAGTPLIFWENMQAVVSMS